MRTGRGLLVLLILLATACNPTAPAPTPTLVPSQLPDAGMQQAALAAVQDYAKSAGYEYRNPSLSVFFSQNDGTIVHASVSFQTRQGFPFEDYDALINMHKTGSTWQAEPVKEFSKLDWETALQRGPLTLKSPAGFTANVPAGWVGFVAPESELKPANVCGVGDQALDGIPLLEIMPAGYSAANVPVILRAYQQCPRAPGLTNIRQRLESLRASDKTLNFQKLEMTQLGGNSILMAVVTDATSVAYDLYTIHHERQLEFVIQANASQDLTTILDVLNNIKFN